jgi:hypothetical protein
MKNKYGILGHLKLWIGRKKVMMIKFTPFELKDKNKDGTKYYKTNKNKKGKQ